MLKRLEKYGLDEAAWLALFGRAWGLLERPVTLALVLTELTPVTQGYYTTFANVLQLAIFVELGLGVVLTQCFSHEAAHFGTEGAGFPSRKGLHFQRFVHLLKLSLRWYAFVALAILALVGTAGMLFFRQGDVPNVSWLVPWWGYVAVSAFAGILQPFASALEGIGRVAYVQRLRLLVSVTGGLSGWIALKLGGALFVLWCLPIAQSIVFIVALRRGSRDMLVALSEPIATDARVDWWGEVWPLQWKIAVSWICGYFIYQLYGPVLFLLHGPVVAGQMGVTLQLCNLLTAVSGALVALKAPIFGQLIARREYARLDEIFRRNTIFATVLSGLLSLLVLAAVWLGGTLTPYGERFLPLWQVTLLLLGNLVNTVIASQAVYLRAHKREPFLVLSLIGAICQVSVIFGLGVSYGAAGIVVGNVVATVLISLPLAFTIFVRCRRAWHSDTSIGPAVLQPRPTV